MATFKIISTRENSVKSIENVSPTNLGELKTVFEENGIDYSGMSIVLKRGKQTLELDAAEIPEGDNIIYLSPSKVKSGYVDYDEFDADTAEGLAAFAAAVQLDVAVLLGKIDILLRGVTAQAEAITGTSHPTPTQPVEEEDEDLFDDEDSYYYDEEEEELSEEDQALLDEAKELGL